MVRAVMEHTDQQLWSRLRESARFAGDVPTKEDISTGIP